MIGTLRGVIVVPEWALALERRVRRLMLAHEREHLVAGDTRLAFLGILAVLLMPWNLPLWWQVRRLRVALELDCDARVLRGEPDAHTYGALLIEVGRRRSGLGITAVAFADSPSALERRICALVGFGAGRRPPCAVAFGLVAAALVASAVQLAGPGQPLHAQAPRDAPRTLAAVPVVPDAGPPALSASIARAVPTVTVYDHAGRPGLPSAAVLPPPRSDRDPMAAARSASPLPAHARPAVTPGAAGLADQAGHVDASRDWVDQTLADVRSAVSQILALRVPPTVRRPASKPAAAAASWLDAEAAAVDPAPRPMPALSPEDRTALRRAMRQTYRQTCVLPEWTAHELCRRPVDRALLRAAAAAWISHWAWAILGSHRIPNAADHGDDPADGAGPDA